VVHLLPGGFRLSFNDSDYDNDYANLGVHLCDYDNGNADLASMAKDNR
jgi:hypothetical protein